MSLAPSGRIPALGLVLGQGAAFDSATDALTVQTVAKAAAIEPVGPLPEKMR
jgi:hypothetical protein